MLGQRALSYVRAHLAVLCTRSRRRTTAAAVALPSGAASTTLVRVALTWRTILRSWFSPATASARRAPPWPPPVNNVANANTPGYSRQIAVFVGQRRHDRAGRRARWAPASTLQSMTQARDQFIERQMPNALAAPGLLDHAQRCPQRPDRARSELQGGLLSALGAFYASLQTLSQNPGDVALAAGRHRQQPGARQLVQLRPRPPWTAPAAGSTPQLAGNLTTESTGGPGRWPT